MSVHRPALLGAVLLAPPRLPEVWGRGAGPVLALTAALTLLVAVPVVLGAWYAGRRSRRGRPEPTPPAYGDRLDVLEATREALARRDLIGGEVAVLVLDLADPAQAGADVARQVVRRLRAWLPAQDSVLHLDRARFVVVTEGIGAEGAERLARRLVTLLGEPFHGRDVAFLIGLAVSGPALDDAADLFEAATTALGPARVKAMSLPETRPQIAWHRHDPRALAGATDAALTAELRTALRDHRLQAIFQPVRGVRTDGLAEPVVAMRALPRWSRSDGSHVPVSRFRPIAEGAGLADDLGLQLVDLALDAATAWYGARYPVGRLAVPLRADLIAHDGVAATVLSRLARRDLPTRCLLIELDVAESTEPDRLAPVVATLREHGVEVLLTGVVQPGPAVPLARRLGAGGIVLHPVLTATMAGAPVPVAAALAACHRHGLRCVADGVADLDQLDAARRLGLDAAAGPAVAGVVRARDVGSLFELSRR